MLVAALNCYPGRAELQLEPKGEIICYRLQQKVDIAQLFSVAGALSVELALMAIGPEHRRRQGRAGKNATCLILSPVSAGSLSPPPITARPVRELTQPHLHQRIF